MPQEFPKSLQQFYVSYNQMQIEEISFQKLLSVYPNMKNCDFSRFYARLQNIVLPPNFSKTESIHLGAYMRLAENQPHATSLRRLICDVCNVPLTIVSGRV